MKFLDIFFHFQVSYQSYGDTCNMSVPCNTTKGLVCSFTGYNSYTGSNINPDCNCPITMTENQCDWYKNKKCDTI